jgi:hypothetical protein
MGSSFRPRTRNTIALATEESSQRIGRYLLPIAPIEKSGPGWPNMSQADGKAPTKLSDSWPPPISLRQKALQRRNSFADNPLCQHE